MIKIPDEILLELADNLSKLSPRDAQRCKLVERTAAMFGCSCETVYRQLAHLRGPRRCTRSDQGRPRGAMEADYKRWVEVVAAVKLATRNKKGRHLSTSKAIELAEEGVYLEGRFEQIPKGKLQRSNCDRWMQRLGISIHYSLRQTPAIRFEARESNECWQFDISVSDAHYLAEQKVLPEAGQSGYPHLGLFSVVDDHSRVSYQEYHLVYGEEVEAGLLFLFRAMAAKDDPSFPFQGIPKTVYLDNGPLAKSRVVRRVLEEKLGISIKVHETPQAAGSRRTAARSKGKVERCFRTLKESFETLFHFHQPESTEEANRWLLTHLLHYNSQKHPTREGSRIEVWAADLPPEGFRQMCSWETYARFAREPEYRTVDDNSRITLDHQVYRVTGELRGERVEVWKGVFDNVIYIQDKGGNNHGPYPPESGAIPFGTFRRWRKTEQDRELEKVERLAQQITIPRETLFRDRRSEEERGRAYDLRSTPFPQPVGMWSENYGSMKEARRGIYAQFGIPLGELSDEVLGAIDEILRETLNRREVYRRTKELFAQHRIGG
jgi:hypothetical protein